MKNLTIGCFLVFLMAIACASCKKEFSCEGCRDGNRPPTAVAGTDQVITLPADSLWLNGSASSDPDGTIARYQWTKIAGPAAFGIVSPNDSSTRVRSLVAGIYQFELTVTDDGGLSSMDTVQVMVYDVGQTNRPPVADAGKDQNVSDSAVLDGRGSTDPDNNITGYLWKKISGPPSFLVDNPGAVQTLVTRLDSGVYLFELTVTDAGGLFSKDTVQVIKKDTTKVTDPGDSVRVACDNSLRPLIDAQLLPVTSMPAGSGEDFVVYGNRIYFMTIECPDCTGSTKRRAYYNIFDLGTQTWSRSSEYLVTPRKYGATIIAAGNRIFYAGGAQSNPPNPFTVLPDVDIYDVQANTWSSTVLSKGGYDISGAIAGNRVLFAGGLRADPVMLAKPSAIIDVFDLSTNTWSLASLSQARAHMSVVTVNGKVYFAGGSAGENAISGFLGASDVIDMYDYATDTWSVSALAQPKAHMASIVVGMDVYWAGGLGPWEGLESSVEIRELDLWGSAMSCLHQENFWWYGKNGAALMGNEKIVFFAGFSAATGSSFDIYNVNTNTWSVGQLPFEIADASIFSHNSNVYVVGGKVNGAISNRIWKLVF